MANSAGVDSRDAQAGPMIDVVGLHGGEWFGSLARTAIFGADCIVGAQRQHDDLDAATSAASTTGLEKIATAERVKLFGPLDQVLDLIEERATSGQKVCMLASGDPGFFGIERLLVGRFGDRVAVHPAPSSVALAFARARIHWDDAAIVSCHGRPLEKALPHILAAPKVAVLVSKTTPPEAVGRALLESAADGLEANPHKFAVVCSRLGQEDESVVHLDIAGLAAGTFDPLSVLILSGSPQPIATNAIVAWGRPVNEFSRRASMITKPEVRAIVLSKLELFGAGVLWDVGAASGSIGIEAARLAPGLRVYAIERNAKDCEHIRSNAKRVALTVVHGEAPDAFEGLADPDRVFVGGGGLDVFRQSLMRLRPEGMIVATFATLESALEAHELLRGGAEAGAIESDGVRAESGFIQVCVNRGVPIGPEARLRLQADNPVFVVWGTRK